MMAERRLHGLQRVLGVNALFSTAYGNVGSSIYYALGLVASFALGLTPVVFVITGLIFCLTAVDLRRGDRDVPRGGRLVELRAPRLQRVLDASSPPGRRCSTTSITIAISAFFVPHYLGGLFWEPLRRRPATSSSASASWSLLSLVNVVGVKESAGVNVTLAVIDFATQLLLVLVGAVLVLLARGAGRQRRLRRSRRRWKDFFLAIPIGMIAYTGIETISNMAEEARDETTTIPEAINRVVIAVFAIYAALPAVALSALPVTQNAGPASTRRSSALPEEEGGYAGDPILGVVNAIDLGALQSAAEIYVGLLAATILFIATNAGIIGVSRLVVLDGHPPPGARPPAPAAPASSARRGSGSSIFGGVACLAMIPGPGRVPGQHLRVRRDAVVHDRAPGADPAALHASPTSSARTAAR